MSWAQVAWQRQVLAGPVPVSALTWPGTQYRLVLVKGPFGAAVAASAAADCLGFGAALEAADAGCVPWALA